MTASAGRPVAFATPKQLPINPPNIIIIILLLLTVILLSLIYYDVIIIIAYFERSKVVQLAQLDGNINEKLDETRA